MNPISDEAFTEHRRREDEFIRSQPLTKLAEKYLTDAQKLLDKKEDWLIFSAPDDETKNEMLEIIYWYQFFIAAKLQRGFSGILDFDGNLDQEEINDPQSDANGSVKIALIAVERSKMAWTVLISNENSQTIKPLINLLETIKQTAEKKFPNAYNFVRPDSMKSKL